MKINEEISNKEIIEKLTTYFLEQNPQIVARILANCILDIHRMNFYSSLPYEEIVSLFKRMQLNSQQLVMFIKEGPQSPLTFGNLNEQNNRD